MSGLPFTSQVTKYILFLFNLGFVLTGIIIISVGGLIKAAYNEYATFLDDKYFSVPNLMIAIGAVIFVIAFFGCCGAIKENYCMTMLFALLLIGVFVLEFSAGIGGYVLRDRTSDYIADRLNQTIYLYEKNLSIAQVWDDVQGNFTCCGVNGANDWTQALHKVPLSCCPKTVGILGTFECTDEKAYKMGCLPAFQHFLEEHAVILGGVGLGLAFIQLLGIIFSCYLAKSIKKGYETM